jgi:apolipoprotein N-acyltransferase
VPAEILSRTRDHWVALLLAALSGLLYALSFPPAALPLLGWIALVPLFLAVSRVPPRWAFLLGVCWCVVAATGVAGFLSGMVAEFFGVSGLVGAAVFAGVVALLSPLYGAYTAWLSWLVRRRAPSAALAAAGWGVCEFARSAPAPGGGWALLAYSQVPFERVIQSVDLAGPYALGMLMVVVSFCLASLVSPVLRGRRFVAMALGAAAAVVGLLVYGDARLSQSFGSGPPVPVALVQGGVEREQRRDPAHRDASLKRQLELTGTAARGLPALIFWPEYAVDFYLREDSPERARLFEVARASGADLILGGPHYRMRTSPPRYYTSVFLIREGRFGGRYDKTAPLPFAERNPLQEILPLEVHYSPGERVRPLETSVLPVGAFLCSEALDPALPRRLARAGAELLTNPANDDWFGTDAAARLHLHTARVRAIENRRYLVRATATGYSAIVDPRGRVTAMGSAGGSEVVSGVVQASRAVTLYQQVGEASVGLALTMMLVSSGCLMRPRRSRNGGTS